MLSQYHEHSKEDCYVEVPRRKNSHVSSKFFFKTCKLCSPLLASSLLGILSSSPTMPSYLGLSCIFIHCVHVSSSKFQDRDRVCIPLKFQHRGIREEMK